MVRLLGGDRRDADNVSLPTRGEWNLARRDVGTKSGTRSRPGREMSVGAIKGVLAMTDCRLLILDKV
jgi:hypothetical protein